MTQTDKEKLQNKELSERERGARECAFACARVCLREKEIRQTGQDRKTEEVTEADRNTVELQWLKHLWDHEN